MESTPFRSNTEPEKCIANSCVARTWTWISYDAKTQLVSMSHFPGTLATTGDVTVDAFSTKIITAQLKGD